MADPKPTAMSFRYEDMFKTCSTKFANVASITKKGTFPVPGMQITNVLGANCGCMTPQGITVAGNYVLVSAYCNYEKYLEDLAKHKDAGENAAKYEKSKGHKQHKSVLYVVDKKSHALLATLALDDCTHAGGITYDGKYVWVCKDTDKKMSYIKFSDLDAAVKGKKNAVSYAGTVDCGGNAIFCMCYGGLLWVGDSHSQANGLLNGFEVKEFLGKVKLDKVRTVELPILAQGALMVDIDGATYFGVSVSGGRVNPTEISLYKLDLKSGNKAIKLGAAECKSLGKLTLPPMGEDIAIDGNSGDAAVYTLFESVSTPYSCIAGHPCEAIMDRVCISTAKEWLGGIKKA